MRDHIQYAEIRPNFMQTNQIWKDDGSERLDNEETVQIIQDVYREWCQTLRDDKRRIFWGLKIIYCTPRSFSNQLVWEALEECLRFKIKWPNLIAGMSSGSTAVHEANGRRV